MNRFIQTIAALMISATACSGAEENLQQPQNTCDESIHRLDKAAIDLDPQVDMMLMTLRKARDGDRVATMEIKAYTEKFRLEIQKLNDAERTAIISCNDETTGGKIFEGIPPTVRINWIREKMKNLGHIAEVSEQ